MGKKERSVTLKTKNLVLHALTRAEAEALTSEDALPDKEAVFAAMEAARAHPEAAEWYTLWTVRRRKTDELLGAFAFGGREQGPTAVLSLLLDLAAPGTPDLPALTGEALLEAAQWAQGHEDVYFTEIFAPEITEERRAVLAGAGFAPDTVPGFEDHWFRERPAFPAIPIYMTLGISMGLAIGSSLNNIGVGEAIGVALGVAAGAAIQSLDHKSRAGALAERKRLQTGGDTKGEDQP